MSSDRNRVGFLHPGEMGVSLAASARNSGCEVYWASEGRSDATHKRAQRERLKDAGTLAELCRICPILISVCPPDAAETVARQVLACEFRGLYVDANAIAPQRAVNLSRLVEEAGARFVDGGIIGEPAWEPGTTWLHLSGQYAAEVEPCFAAGPLQTSNLGSTIGRASALKMCFAANTKGSVALLAAIFGTAERLGVREALERQWNARSPGFAEQAQKRVLNVTGRAWRFAGEMREISATFASAGMPGEFHQGAADIYARLTRFKDADPAPQIEEVIREIIGLDPEI